MERIAESLPRQSRLPSVPKVSFGVSWAEIPAELFPPEELRPGPCSATGDPQELLASRYRYRDRETLDPGPYPRLTSDGLLIGICEVDVIDVLGNFQA